MAEEACHVVASTTQVGLIQALGLTGNSSMLDSLMFVLGCIGVLYGVVGLLATWVFPALHKFPFWGRGMLMGRMEPTRLNRTIMCFWSIFFGAYISLSFSDHRLLGAIAAAAFLVTAIIAVVIRSKSANKA